MFRKLREKLICQTFGHRYRVSRAVTHSIKEYECKCCKHEITIDIKGNITPLTENARNLNAVLARMYKVKRKRAMLTTQQEHSSLAQSA